MKGRWWWKITKIWVKPWEGRGVLRGSLAR